MENSNSTIGTLHIPNLCSDLPDSWFWKRLENACIDVVDCPHSTPRITPSGSLMVRSQDIRSGVFRFDQAAKVSEQTYQERIKRAEPTHGDLVYSREGTYFGIAAEVPKGIRVCLGQRMVLLRPDPKQLHFRYLKYWLNSPILQSHIHGLRDGTVAERLNLPTIRALPIPIPPISVQDRIANILGTLDDKIELNRQMNETLEAMARRLFRSWFVDFDPVHAKAAARREFPGMNNAELSRRALPNMSPEIAELFPDSFQDTTLGPIPKGWNMGRIGDSFNLTMGQSPPGSTYNEIGVGMPFYQGKADFQSRFPARRVYCTAPTRTAKRFDTLVSVRAPVGAVNMASEDCSIGRGIAAIRHQSGSASFTYYAMLEKDEAFQRFEADGTVFGSINKSDFEKIQVILPSKPIINAFEAKASENDKLIYSNSSDIENLKSIRDRLLPKLLSGELSVR